MTRQEVEVKHGIGNSQLSYWLGEMGYDYLKLRIVSLFNLKLVNIDTNGKDSQKSSTELQEAKLLTEVYRKII
jgi:hypothetical protein